MPVACLLLLVPGTTIGSIDAARAVGHGPYGHRQLEVLASLEECFRASVCIPRVDRVTSRQSRILLLVVLFLLRVLTDRRHGTTGQASRRRRLPGSVSMGFLAEILVKRGGSPVAISTGSSWPLSVLWHFDCSRRGCMLD